MRSERASQHYFKRQTNSSEWSTITNAGRKLNSHLRVDSVLLQELLEEIFDTPIPSCEFTHARNFGARAVEESLDGAEGISQTVQRNLFAHFHRAKKTTSSSTSSNASSSRPYPELRQSTLRSRPNSYDAIASRSHLNSQPQPLSQDSTDSAVAESFRTPPTRSRREEEIRKDQKIAQLAVDLKKGVTRSRETTSSAALGGRGDGVGAGPPRG